MISVARAVLTAQVLDVALECSRTLAPEMGRHNALSFAVTLRKVLSSLG